MEQLVKSHDELVSHVSSWIQLVLCAHALLSYVTRLNVYLLYYYFSIQYVYAFITLCMHMVPLNLQYSK